MKLFHNTVILKFKNDFCQIQKSYEKMQVDASVSHVTQRLPK